MSSVGTTPRRQHQGRTLVVQRTPAHTSYCAPVTTHTWTHGLLCTRHNAHLHNVLLCTRHNTHLGTRPIVYPSQRTPTHTSYCVPVTTPVPCREVRRRVSPVVRTSSMRTPVPVSESLSPGALPDLSLPENTLGVLSVPSSLRGGTKVCLNPRTLLRDVSHLDPGTLHGSGQERRRGSQRLRDSVHPSCWYPCTGFYLRVP